MFEIHSHSPRQKNSKEEEKKRDLKIFDGEHF